MWEPMSDEARRHLIRSTSGGYAPDDDIEQRSHRFWVPRGTPFRISSNQRTLGSIHIIESEQTPFRVSGHDGSATGTVLIGLLSAGSCDIEFPGGGGQRVAPGGALIVPDWNRCTLSATTSTRGLTLLIPQRRLVERGVRLTSAFRGTHAFSLTSPLRHFASAVTEATWRPTLVAELVSERTIEDLLVGAFLETTGFAMDGDDLRAGLRARALAVVRERHRDPLFTPHTLAHLLGVSLRHLQRAFHDSDFSVATSIARARAESAEILLSSPGGSSLTLCEIASRVGFTSAFELRSAFRHRFDELPSDLRRRAAERQAHALPASAMSSAGPVPIGSATTNDTPPNARPPRSLEISGPSTHPA